MSRRVLPILGTALFWFPPALPLTPDLRVAVVGGEAAVASEVVVAFIRGGRVAFRRGFGGGRAHVSHPIAGVGRPHPSRNPIAGVPGWGTTPAYPSRPIRPEGGYPGYGGRFPVTVGVMRVMAGFAATAGDCYYYGTCGGGDYYDDSTDQSQYSDAVEACAQRFRTYDRATQTYVAKGGKRKSARNFRHCRADSIPA